jgi:hypothetical protein
MKRKTTLFCSLVALFVTACQMAPAASPTIVPPSPTVRPSNTPMTVPPTWTPTPLPTLTPAPSPVPTKAPADETPTTIGFIKFANGSPLTIYHESGFTVSSSSGAWIASTTYGHPSPYIYFDNPDGDAVASGIKITRDHSTFKFNSVDLYSSITQIPYIFIGYLESNRVFKVTGTIPNTSGDFATALNSHDMDVIDTLEIMLTNPASIGPNLMGLDNIVLTFSPNPN